MLSDKMVVLLNKGSEARKKLQALQKMKPPPDKKLEHTICLYEALYAVFSVEMEMNSELFDLLMSRAEAFERRLTLLEERGDSPLRRV